VQGVWVAKLALVRASVRRHPGFVVFALLCICAGAALLLAHSYHLGVAAVLAGVIVGLPSLFVGVRTISSAPAPAPPDLTTDTAVAAPKPVTEWKAFDLGVHRAIDVGAGDPARLPSYVCRSHDRELRGLLSGVDKNTMVVLVGGSCTGKTRACYEAVRKCLPDWPMFRPFNAPELERLLSGQRPGERAVIWLDEAHNYLDVGLQRGAEAVQCLQHALTGGPGPLIVIGSMPSEHWANLTAEPGGGQGQGMQSLRWEDQKAKPMGRQGDPHWQARTLLGMDAVRQIKVPDDFSSAEPAELRELDLAAVHDPRLAAAKRTGGDQLPITQVLAGGVQLLDRYQHPSDPYSPAVITAAMDARRLAHLNAIPPALLEEAVPGYLPASQRIAPASWFSTALAKAAEAVLGVRALTPTRRQPGMGGPDGYILHDYLYEHAVATREAVAVPASLWDALLARTASPADLTQVAVQAKDRGLYRYAVLAAARAAEAADAGAVLFAVRLLSEAGRVDECIAWLRPFAEAGDAEAMLLLATELLKTEQENRYRERLAWLERAAESGHARAMWELVDLFGTSPPELAERAIRWLRQLAGGEDLKAMQRLADLLDSTGQAEDAAYWRQQHAAAETRLREETRRRRESAEKRAEVKARIGWLMGLGETGPYPRPEIGASIPALRSQAIAGDLRAMERLAKLLDEAGQTAEAMKWLTQAAAAGRDTAAWNLAQVLHGAGRDEEALATIRQAADYWADDWIAFQLVIPWLREVGGQAALKSFLMAGASAGNGWAAVYLARELGLNGQTDEAIRWLEPAANQRNLGAMEFLGVLLDQVGQGAKAPDWYQRVDEAISPDMLFVLATMLENSGWLERALIRYRNALECKYTAAMEPLTKLLKRMSRTDEAQRLRLFGIEPGGHTAQPWQVPQVAPIVAAMDAE
jgi:TPR repeat protein